MSLTTSLQRALALRPAVAVQETVVTKSTKTVIEMRPIETNEHFRFLEECVQWVGAQMVRRSSEKTARAQERRNEKEGEILNDFSGNKEFQLYNVLVQLVNA